MCVWDLSAPSVPKAVLISEGTPSCCGFAPSPATNIVFAGACSQVAAARGVGCVELPRHGEGQRVPVELRNLSLSPQINLE